MYRTKRHAKLEAGDSLICFLFIVIILTENRTILCESSARQTMHMKCQASFSLNDDKNSIFGILPETYNKSLREHHHALSVPVNPTLYRESVFTWFIFIQFVIKTRSWVLIRPALMKTSTNKYPESVFGSVTLESIAVFLLKNAIYSHFYNTFLSHGRVNVMKILLTMRKTTRLKDSKLTESTLTFKKQ